MLPEGRTSFAAAQATLAASRRGTAVARLVCLTDPLAAASTITGSGVRACGRHIGARRLVPHLCLWALRRETPAAACSLASIRAAQALEPGPEPPSIGAESSSSTSDELWPPSSGDPTREPGAFMAPFLSNRSRPDQVQPSRLCLYFATSQVPSPATRAHAHSSPCPRLAPRAGAQHPAGRRGARGVAAIRLQLELLGRPMAAGAPGAGCGPAPPPLPLPARLCTPGSCSAARRGRSRARRRAPRAPAGAGGRICSCCCCRATGVLGRAAARAAARSACVVAPL